MDEQNSKPTPEAPKDLVFNVMPRDGASGPYTVSAPPPPPSPSGMSMAPRPSSRKWTYIIIGLIVVLALGGLAYWMLGTQKSEAPQTVTTQLPKAWLSKYFNNDACTDLTTCGDGADPENDGLTNYDEFKAGTNPLNPDTDGDGLADGDEINIYKTDPTLKFTDRREIVATNNWSDGFQINGGYDPLTPGIKLTDARKSQIAADTTTYHLHEPSITTTTTVVPPAPPTSTQ